MRKRGWCLLCVGLIAVVLSAVPLFAADTITLNFWSQWNDPGVRKFADDWLALWAKEFPNIKIVHRVLPNDSADELMRTAFVSGSPPDICYQEAVYDLFQWAKDGKVRNVKQIWDKYPGRFNPGAIPWVSDNSDVRWGIPLQMVCEGHIFYNVDLCKKYGVDPLKFKDYNDFLAACQKFKDNGITPIALGNKPGWPGSQWYQYFLGETLQKGELWACLNRTKKDQSPKWTDPGFVKAAQYFKDLVDKGYFDEGSAMMEYDAGKMQFFSQRSPFFYTGSWYETLQPPPDLHWSLFRCPHITGEPGAKWLARTVTFLGSFVASTKCAYPDAQMKWMEFMSRPSTGRLFWQDSKAVPAIVGAVKDSELNAAQKEYMWLYRNATIAIPYLEYFVNPEAGYGAIYNGSVGITSGQLSAQEYTQQVEEAAIKTYQ